MAASSDNSTNKLANTCLNSLASQQGKGSNKLSSRGYSIESRVFHVIDAAEIQLTPHEIACEIYKDGSEGWSPKKIKPGQFSTVRGACAKLLQKGLVVQPYPGAYCNKITHGVLFVPLCVHNVTPAEDAASQAAFGLREYPETDEELQSDAECTRRAAALLALLKDPNEHVNIVSTILDYGTSPILGGDVVHIHLPTEGVDADFRTEWAEYRVRKEAPTELEITIDAGRENPRLADFIYGLRCHSPNVEKLSRTKIGRRGAPVMTGGSSQGASHFTTNVEIEKVSPVLNLLISGALKIALGHDGSNGFLSCYQGNLVLYSASHIIAPVGDGVEALGDTASAWRYKSLHLKEELWVAGVNTVDNTGRVSMAGMPRSDAGKIIEAAGAGFYPVWVDPNGRYTPAAHDHTSLIRGTKTVQLDAIHAVANFLDGVTLKGAVGHDGDNMFLVAYDGSLVLYSATGKILPNADGGTNLGDTAIAKRFGSLHLKNDIWVAGVQVVDTNGRIALTGLPRDTAGKVLEAQGVDFAPMYVDPNGRYAPAAHSHPYAPIGATASVSFMDGSGVPRTMLFSNGVFTGVV